MVPSSALVCWTSTRTGVGDMRPWEAKMGRPMHPGLQGLQGALHGAPFQRARVLRVRGPLVLPLFGEAAPGWPGPRSGECPVLSCPVRSCPVRGVVTAGCE